MRSRPIQSSSVSAIHQGSLRERRSAIRRTPAASFGRLVSASMRSAADPEVRAFPRYTKCLHDGGGRLSVEPQRLPSERLVSASMRSRPIQSSSVSAKHLASSQERRLATRRIPPASFGRWVQSPVALHRSNGKSRRNRQFNIKATAETVDRFYKMADERKVPLCELLEQALGRCTLNAVSTLPNQGMHIVTLSEKYLSSLVTAGITKIPQCNRPNQLQSHTENGRHARALGNGSMGRRNRKKEHQFYGSCRYIDTSSGALPYVLMAFAFAGDSATPILSAT